MANELISMKEAENNIAREIRINNFTNVMNNTQLERLNTNIIGSRKLLLAGMGVINDSIEEASQGIINSLDKTNKQLANVANELNYGFGKVVGELNILNDKLNMAVDTLNAIHETLKHPLETASQEQFMRGIEWMKKGLLEESIEAFKLSIEKNITNFFSHYYLGLIYLSGKDDDEDVRDYGKAVEELKLAVKYGKPDMDVPEVKGFVINSYKYLADAYYSIAEKATNKEEYYQLAYESICNAAKIDSSKETKLSLAGRMIRYANNVNDKKTALEYASLGFINDTSFVEMFTDASLKNLYPEFEKIIEDSSKKLLEQYIDYLSSEKGDYRLERINKINSALTSTDLHTYAGISLANKIAETYVPAGGRK